MRSLLFLIFREQVDLNCFAVFRVMYTCGPLKAQGYHLAVKVKCHIEIEKQTE